MKRIFLLCSLLFVLSCNNEMVMKRELAEAFVKSINAQDTQSMEALMSTDHEFILSDSSWITPANAAVQKWQQYFRFFPDFKIEVESIAEMGEDVAVFGKISGTLKVGDQKGPAIRIPLSVRMNIRNGKIFKWQMFANDARLEEMMATAAGRDKGNLDVQNFGGVFFKAKDPKSLSAWYDQYLGTKFGDTGYCMFEWAEKGNPGLKGSTTFSIFSEKSDYYAPSNSSFMLNFRVNNLDGLMEKLKAAGVQTVGEIDRFDYGNFGWIIDPEGNKIELWEPVDGVLEAYEEQKEN